MSARRSGSIAAPSATMPLPPGMRATRVDLGGEEFVVLAWDLARPRIAGLSLAEAEVARLVLDGCSNAAIAARRMTSVGTVAKQVARVYRKLGVHSRSGLSAAAASGSPLEGHDPWSS